MDEVSEAVDSVAKIANLTSDQISKLQVILKPNGWKKNQLKIS